MHNLILSPINPDTLIEKTASKTFELINSFLLNHNQDAEELLTIKEAANFLRTTSTSLWRMQKAGTIKLYGLGGKRYYKKSELLRALQEIN